MARKLEEPLCDSLPVVSLSLFGPGQQLHFELRQLRAFASKHISYVTSPWSQLLVSPTWITLGFKRTNLSEFVPVSELSVQHFTGNRSTPTVLCDFDLLNDQKPSSNANYQGNFTVSKWTCECTVAILKCNRDQCHYILFILNTMLAEFQYKWKIVLSSHTRQIFLDTLISLVLCKATGQKSDAAVTFQQWKKRP